MVLMDFLPFHQVVIVDGACIDVKLVILLLLVLLVVGSSELLDHFSLSVS